MKFFGCENVTPNLHPHLCCFALFCVALRFSTATFIGMMKALNPFDIKVFKAFCSVHHREKMQGVTEQKVEIYFKMIGYVQLPALNEKKLSGLQMGFGREEGGL